VAEPALVALKRPGHEGFIAVVKATRPLVA